MSQIFTDELTRRLYAADASMYEELPDGVSFPKSISDIRQLVKLSSEKPFSITARSAGTSLAGQTTGNGVIMDVSRFMTEIIRIDPEERTALVQPGVIRDSLNRAAAQFGLQFGPDTATTNRCMIGGMIGNNSCGSFSIKHKTTREHILEIEAVLSDGSIAVFRPLQEKELDEKCALDNLEGQIYRQMLELLRKHKEAIFENYPHPEIIRRNTGYALDRLCEMSPITAGGRPFNLAELLCGSEGTLAMTAAAKLNLVPLPAKKTLLIPQFESLHDAMLATVEAVKWEPAAVELVDDVILDATRRNIEQRKNRFFLEGEPKCILIIQFEGDSEADLVKKAEGLSRVLREKGFGYTHPILTDPEKMQRVWNLRKAGLGLLMGLGSESRSPTFVEDTAVRVQDLPDYVREFQDILDRHQTSCVFYAHASVGELHLRPVIDTTRPEGLQTLKQIADEVSVLVKKYRGSLSGEHGDGRARSPYIEAVLGSEMVELLRRVKKIWDPGYRLNPGKIVNPRPLHENLRFSPAYRKPEVDTTFHWRPEDGFDSALELCNGAGVCRKLAESGGTMCPSYHATREEKDSTRGRANLFRQVFSGRQADAFTSEELKEALSLCLSCKACKSECPANVDMAKMKAEFTHGWHQKNGISAAEKFFGSPEKFYPLASAFSPLVNALNRSVPVKKMFEWVAGIDSRRDLPGFAAEPFHKWYQENGNHGEPSHSKQVLLLVDIFNNYHEPEIAVTAYRLLTALGYHVISPGIWPTGRPQISKGLLNDARDICRENIRRFAPFAEMGIPIVGLEPSELLTLRDEYRDLCDHEEIDKANEVADHAYLLEEFLLSELEPDALQIGNGRKVYLHGHCHTKALVGNEPLLKLLRNTGFEPVDLQTGCCGMAGSFGYEKDKFEVSMQIGEQVLFPALRSLPGDALVCAPGFSCRHQITDGTGKKSMHHAQILWEFLMDQSKRKEG